MVLHIILDENIFAHGQRKLEFSLLEKVSKILSICFPLTISQPSFFQVVKALVLISIFLVFFINSIYSLKQKQNDQKWLIHI